MKCESSELLQIRVSKRIATRRRELKLTQAELAERVGVDTETISRFERGKHLPSLLCLERIALELHTSMGALLDTAGSVETNSLDRIIHQAELLNINDFLFFSEIATQLALHLLNRNQVVNFTNKTRQDKTRQDKTRQQYYKLKTQSLSAA